MKLPAFLRSKLLTISVAGLCGLELLATAGCVAYPTEGGGVTFFPPPLPVPVVNVGVYGSPAGYYYRNYPVYAYGGRHCYYHGGRRYWYSPGGRYYHRRGYRVYY